jgi:tryptophan synthase beta subunit
MPKTSQKDIVVVNLSGRGDKDMPTYMASGITRRKK